MNNRVKLITIIADNYPGVNHVSFVFVQQLVHAMIDLDQCVKINVIAPQSVVSALIHRKSLLPKHSKAITERGKGYDVYRPYIISFGLRNYFAKFTYWFNKCAVRKLLKKIDSDIIYSHFWGVATLVYEYALNNKKPFFVACGESADHFASELGRMSSNTISEIASAVTGVVSVSVENKRKCIDNSLAKAENIEVFPNCVNVNKFTKTDSSEIKKQLGVSDNDFILAFVGGFISRKGPDRVAKAITKLNDADIKVMFIGKSFAGYEYDFNCPGIIHKGPLDNDLLPKYLSCADVFVLPTQSEGCCNAIVEALAMGLPVISSNGAFNDDILNENNSIRINPDDVDAIANAIKKLKDDAVLRKQMSEYSLSRREEYSIQGRAKRILDFINRRIESQEDSQ